MVLPRSSAGPRCATGHIELRPAVLADLNVLVGIEQACFVSDRFSRRSFRYLLSRARAATEVVLVDGQVVGYAMVLFHRGTSLARLYSLAVMPVWQGRGLGSRLLAVAERRALDQGCVSMRLEVRRDNPGSIALYRRHGYRHFADHPDYYEDHQDALRFEKTLHAADRARLRPVPFYAQTLDFTCGPASLMMAMQALRPELELDRALELRLWRESTTIFMTSGHGGCGPFGLALAARRRGLGVTLQVSEQGVLFVDSVRSQEKKEVMRIVQDDMLAEVQAMGIPLRYGPIDLGRILTILAQGGIPLALISSWRLYGERFPHWVVITGEDARCLYIHDPYVDTERRRTPTDCINIPIAREEFERMIRYGRSAQQALIGLFPAAQAQP